MRVAGYEFAENARFQPGASGSANEVGTHIEMLRQQQKGELQPKDVVEDARNPNSPLHSYFEWNDGAAADAYRLHQARGLIRAVVAVYVRDEQPAIRTKAFVHIPEPSAPHYRSAADAMSTAKTRDLVLQRAWRDLQAWRQRYREIKELSAIFQVIDDVATDILRLGKAG